MHAIGQEAAAFLRACESIHYLIPQQTLQLDDRALIEFSVADLMAKLKSIA